MATHFLKNTLRKRFCFFSLFFLFSAYLYSQPTVLGTSLANGSYTTYDLNSIGVFKQFRLQAASSASVSTRNWEFATGTAASINYTTNWRPYSVGKTLSSNTFIPTTYDNGAKYNSGGGGSSGLLPAITNGNYYTFNVSNSATANNVMQLLETSYNPVTISSVAQSVGIAGAENISITTSVAPNASEYIYVRYSTNSYATSTLVQATGSGTSWTAVIPWQSAATSYYVYSSNKTISEINADVTTYGQIAHDMNTLSLNNNGGSNYSWSFGNIIVKSAGGTAATGAAYSSLTAAGQLFTTLNTGTAHTGAVTVYICANTTETGTTALNNSTNWTSITMQSVGARTISGAPAGGIPLIDLNGADNVTIDGLNTGGNSLIIDNSRVSNTAGTSTIRFINDATTNTIQNCTIKGSTTDPVAGIIFFSTTTGSTGNDGNTITANNITNSADANRPLNAIYSAGTPAKTNSGNTISNNNIYNFLNKGTASNGVQLAANNTTWTISGNSFYETASFAPTAAVTYNIVNVSDPLSTDISISGNYIGGNAASCVGTWTKTNAYNSTFMAITMNVGPQVSVTSSVQNNTIKNFSWGNNSAVTWTAINIPATATGNINIGTTVGNIIGETTGTGSITITNGVNGNGDVYGIYLGGTGTIDCQNNSIGSITAHNTSNFATNFCGIYKAAVAGTTTISNNAIGGSSAKSINASATATQVQKVYGINFLGTAATATISGNTIANLSNSGTEVNTTFVNGIMFTNDATNTIDAITNNTIHDLTSSNASVGTGNSSSVIGISIIDGNFWRQKNISGNTIYNLSNTHTSFAGDIMGIYQKGGSLISTISGNFVYNLYVTGVSSTSAKMYGIYPAQGLVTCYNNIVSLGGDTKTTLYGIYEVNQGNASKFYYNSIYLSGSLISGATNPSYCYRGNASGAATYKNNIFCNTRSSTGGTNLHYGMYVESGAAMATCNNNYYSPGTGGVLGYWNSTNKTSVPIVSGETNSFAINPSFSNAGGTSATDYKIAASSLVAATGTGITTDYAGISRSVTAPIMGAYETLTPLITASATFLTGFQYDPGAGPSSEQTFTVSATGLTTNLVVTPSTNFEISLTSGGAFAAANPITLSQSGGVVATTTIYVRLKAGLATATYPAENVTVTSTDAITRNVACDGIVGVIPTILSSVTTLTGFSYAVGVGPSTQQSYTVSGKNLTSNITVTPPTNFEISTTSGSGFVSTPITLTQSGGTVVSTAIYVRLKSGLAQGNYTAENILMTATDAFNKNVTCSGSVNLNVEIWKSGLLQTSYLTLKAAFDAINAGTYTGVLDIKIGKSTLETAPAVLNASGSGAASYTSINIYPTNSGLSISSGAYILQLIDLNGADNITIDGRVNATGSTPSLSITNSSGACSSVQYSNSASNNILKYCILKAATNLTGVVNINSTDAGGNDNNLIDHNDISAYSRSVFGFGIYMYGTAGANTNNTISNNNIYNFTPTSYDSYGVYISSNSTACTIDGNSFYETVGTSPSSGSSVKPIYINNPSGNGFIVTNNYIGGNAPLATGTWTKATNSNDFSGIYLNVGTAVASTVQNNTIRNIAWGDVHTYWSGITVAAGNVNIGTVTGNVIGSSTGINPIVVTASNNKDVYGIDIASTGTVNCQNNTIGTITAANASATQATNFYGIKVTSASGTINISSNIIGSSSNANNINATCVNTNGSQVVYGIFNNGNNTLTVNANTVANITHGSTHALGSLMGIYSSNGTNTITNNIISDLTAVNPGTAATNTLCGLNLTSTAGVKTVSGNAVYNLTNTHASFTGYVIGLFFQGNTGGNIISKNFIRNLAVTGASSTGASIFGINASSGVSTYFNNIISLGGSSKTTIYGFYDAGVASQTCNFYFNTVYIGGSVASGTNKSYCIYSAASGNTHNYRNNLFSNVRSTSGGSSLHYAISLLNNTNLTLNYNDYYALGSGSMLGSYGAADKSTLALWQTATTQDANSVSTVPPFANAGGTLADNYKPTIGFTSDNTTGVTSDYDLTTRTVAPSMGAYEVLNVEVWKGTLQAKYTNLKSAFDAINAGTHTGDLEIKIVGSTIETASAVLNQNAGVTSLIIYPTTSGLSITGDLASPLIDLNGADNVIFDGRVNATGSTRSLTIHNSNTTNIDGNSTIRLINDATSNTVKYANLRGSSLNGGIITISTSTGSTGNDNNTIDNNYFYGGSGGNPNSAIYGLGTASKENSGNTIVNNDLTGCQSFLITLNSNNSVWNISTNSFYNSGAAILINGSGTSSNTISGNYIGGTAPLCGGTAWTINSDYFRAVQITTSGAVTTFSNNTIKNITINGINSLDYNLVEVLSGNVDITSNTIGTVDSNYSFNFSIGDGHDLTPGYEISFIKLAGSGTINFTGNTISSFNLSYVSETPVGGSINLIYNTGTGDVNVANNIIGSATTANSIFINPNILNHSVQTYAIRNAGTNATISGNTIANLSSNALSTLYAIYSNQSCSITGNTIRDLTSNLSSATTEFTGILISSSGTNSLINGNSIYNLYNSNAGNPGNVNGIWYNGSSDETGTISGNFIHDITVHSSSTAGSIYAIRSNTGKTIVSNNIISLGGNTQTNIYGISENGASGQTKSSYFNTVYITGTPTSGAYTSYAFYSQENVYTRDIRNNLFINARSNNGATGKHYSISMTSGGSIIINYNDYFTSGTDGILGNFGTVDKLTLALWKTATTQDLNSYSIAPDFTNAGSITASDYQIGKDLVGASGTGITADYGLIPRATIPTMGAWERAGMTNKWRGATNSDWNTATNWTLNNIPNADDNLTFDYDPQNHCLLDADRSVTNIINAQSAYRLDLNGKTLTLNGSLNFTNSATMDASGINSKIIFNGNTIQTLPSGALYDNNARQLEVRNSSGVRIAGTVNITGSITATSGTFDALFHTPTIHFTGSTTQSVSSNVFSNNSIHNMGIGNAAGVNIDGDIIVANNLVVQASAKLIIPAGKSLKVNNSVTNHNGAEGIRIKSAAGQANGTFIFNGTAPQATVEFYSKASINASGEKKWQYFGVPVTSITALPTFEGAYVRKWNEAGEYNSKTNPIWTALTNSSVLAPVHGYEISQKNPSTYQLSGTLFNGDISFPLSYTSAATYRGNHIVSNPYTAAINIKNLATIGTDIESTVYLYNTGSFSEWGGGSGGSGTVKDSAGGYTSIPVNQSGYAGLATSIPSLQGFLVKVNTASTLNIPYSSVIKNEQPQRAKQEQDSKVYSIISLVGKDTIDRAWIFTEAHCSEDFDDGWDGTKLADKSDTQIFIAEKHGNMQVSSKDKLHGSYISIVAPAGEALSLKFSQHDPQKIYSRIFVSDLVTGKTIDISEDNSEYHFTATENDNRRFLISTVESALPGGETGNIEVINDNKNVIVLNRSTHDCYISIYDTTGRLVNRCMADGLTTVTVKMPFSTGVYIVNAVSGSERIQKSIVVR